MNNDTPREEKGDILQIRPIRFQLRQHITLDCNEKNKIAWLRTIHSYGVSIILVPLDLHCKMLYANSIWCNHRYR